MTSHPVASASDRMLALDVVKGIAIALMVLGHVVQGLQAAGVAPRAGFWFEATTWIYRFHMQAFFFAAGAVLALRPPGSFAALARRRAGTLYYPHLLWGAIYYVVAISFARYYNSPIENPADLAGHAWRILSGQAGWFLPTLFAVTLLGWPLLVRAPTMALLAALALAALPPRSELEVIQGLTRYAVFFVLGYLTIGRLRRLLAACPATLLSTLGLGLLALIAWSPPLARDHPLPPLTSLGLGAVGVAGLLALSAGLARLQGAGRRLAWIGRASLAVFLLHPLATGAARAILLRVLPGESATLYVTLIAGAGLALSLLGYLLVQRLGLHWLFAWPRPPASGRRGAGRRSCRPLAGEGIRAVAPAAPPDA